MVGARNLEESDPQSLPSAYKLNTSTIIPPGLKAARKFALDLTLVTSYIMCNLSCKSGLHYMSALVCNVIMAIGIRLIYSNR